MFKTLKNAKLRPHINVLHVSLRSTVWLPAWYIKSPVQGRGISQLSATRASEEAAILETATTQEMHNSSVLCLLFLILPLGANHRKKKDSQETSGNACKQTSHKAKASRTFNPPGVRENPGTELPVNRIIDVDGVKLEDTSTRSRDDSEGNLSIEVYISELRSCQGRMRTGVYRTSDLPSLITVKSEKNKSTENQYKATFV